MPSRRFRTAVAAARVSARWCSGRRYGERRRADSILSGDEFARTVSVLPSCDALSVDGTGVDSGRGTSTLNVRLRDNRREHASDGTKEDGNLHCVNVRQEEFF